MPPATTTPSQAEGLTALADTLHRDCCRLLSLLEGLDCVEPGHIEDAHRAQARDSRLVRASISSAAALIRRGHGEVDKLAPEARDSLRARLEQCREALQKVGERYRRLIDKVAAAMDETRRQLAGLRQGGRAVRGYAATARIRA